MAKVRIDIKPYNTHKKIGLKNWETGFRELLRSAALEIFDYFEQPARGFTRNKVSITQKGAPRRTGGDMHVIAGVLEPTKGNKIFSYVNWGTGPRVIVARNYKFLIYRKGYTPATRPGSLQTFAPWSRSGSKVWTTSTYNPGIRARRFDRIIQIAMQGHINQIGRKKFAKLAGQTWRG